MQYRLLFLFLIVFTPFIKTTPLLSNYTEQAWLGCIPTARFTPLTQISSQHMPGYEEQLVPYLKARGVNEKEVIENLFHEDLFHIAHALSLLFEEDSIYVLHNLLADHFSLIEGYTPQIDHVGRELYGPLSFYLPLLDQIAPQLGLIHLRDLVFPSTQVVKVLQQHDPNLLGVTIGRVYFQSISTGEIKCIELFQASPQDEKFPQNIKATQERLSVLKALRSNSEMSPIDHLSIELNTVDEIRSVHNRIHALSSETLIPYQKDISHNPGDGSTQTKALMRDSNETPFNKIVEFVHYQKLK